MSDSNIPLKIIINQLRNFKTNDFKLTVDVTAASSAATLSTIARGGVEQLSQLISFCRDCT